MKFGLFYLFSDFGNIPQRQLFDEVLEEIEFGEELGFDSVWLPEHHFAVYGMLGNPMTLAAVISQRTRTMKIGTAIMVLPFHHPLRLAEDAALVDKLSDGRLLLGVGRGYQPPEFSGFGVAQHNSRAMFLESFDIFKKALSGEKFTYKGNFWTIDEPTEIFPKPIQKPHPPFYMAAISPASYYIAARMNCSLLRSPQLTDLGTVSAAYQGYVDKMHDLGHYSEMLDQPFSVRTYVAPTDEEAKEAAPHAVWFYHLLATLLPGSPGKPKPPAGYESYPRDPRVLARVTEDDVWEKGTCFGSPERVTELMKGYMREAGATSFLTQMRIGGLEHKKVMRSMELFARDVMPELRKEEEKMAVLI
jgi:alkanesulfonate monooxygenase SsuD/methylene tetrahydromethanopterin reductase-like flavin-dependent oxidoreductase (luciferase family)